jgi:hypothetical protein
MAEEKKKFKETTIGKFLNQVAPSIIDMVGDVLPPVKLLKGMFDQTPDVPPEQRVEFEKLLKDYEERELSLLLADVKDARDMQKTALNQQDNFSKRFVYYFAAVSSFLSFAYIFLITFVPIPPENQRFADTILGVVIGMVLASVYGFLFGTTKSSQEKSQVISSFIDTSKS